MPASMFGTVITRALTSTDNNTVLSLALGATTMAICTTTQSLTFNGIDAVGGNVDGMVVTVQLINGGSFAFSFAHNNSGAGASGILNPGNATVATGTAFGAWTGRYTAGSVNRWLTIGLV